jgi:hypothetical protein
MAQKRTEAGTQRVPLGACDYFLLALDDMMGRAGQGQHVGQTILELEQVPDPERLRRSLEKLNEKHPLLTARIKRDFFSRVPYWVPVPSSRRKIPFTVLRERGATAFSGPGEVAGVEWKLGEVEDFHRFCEDCLNQPMGSEVGPSNFRVDLVLRKEGGSAIVTTWSHLLLDGKGAELILSEWLRLAETDDLTTDEQSPALMLPQDNLSLWERLKAGRASARRFGTLSRKFIRSLGGTKPTPSKARFRVVTLSPEDTSKVKEQAVRLTGALFNMPFYLACSARVHDTVLRGRGVVCPSFIVSLPVQIRRKGSAGPIFQNHLSILFFHLASEELATVESSTRAVQNDFMLMMRDRLDVSFLRVLGLMRRLPLSWYIAFAKSHFRGELASFFHSHTGPLSPDIRSFFGIEIRNAYHIPTVSTPPGSGIFMCERDGKLNITVSWRDGALSEAECDQMVAQLVQDLQGTEQPAEAKAL